MDCSSWPIFIWLGSVFGYVLQLFYNIFKNYGLAIVFFTLVTRIIMFPLNIKQQKTMADQARLQPKLKQLQQRYGNDKMAYNQAMQELYEKEGVSPSGGCLPMLLQFPLFFGMYIAIRRPLYCVLHVSKDVIQKLAELFNIDTSSYYFEIEIINKLRSGINNMAVSASDVVSGTSLASASDVVSASNALSGSDLVTSAGDVLTSVDMNAVSAILGDRYDHVVQMCNSFNFLGIDLLQTAALWNGALILAVLVFVAQVGSMIFTNKINKVESAPGCNQNVMAVGMGALSLMFAFSMPAAFPLYWATSAIFSPLQSWVTREFFGPVVMNAKSEAQRNARLKNDEQKVIDSVTKAKGKLALKPEPPKDGDLPGNSKRKKR